MEKTLFLLILLTERLLKEHISFEKAKKVYFCLGTFHCWVVFNMNGNNGCTKILK